MLGSRCELLPQVAKFVDSDAQEETLPDLESRDRRHCYPGQRATYESVNFRVCFDGVLCITR